MCFVTMGLRVLAFAFLLLSASLTSAQGQTGRRGTSVAVIDMAKVLREHLRLNSAMAELKKQQTEHEASTKKRREELEERTTQLKQFAPDSSERRRREREIEKERTELERSIERSSEEFSKRTAKLHYDAYREIRAEAENFAQLNRIDLVLNFDSSELSAENPEELKRRLQDLVVYQGRLNITEMVIARVNAGNAESWPLVDPRPVKRYPLGTRVTYAAQIPRHSRPAKVHVLPRKAADRVIEMTNGIKPHDKPTRLAPYTCAPLGTFKVGESGYYLLQEGMLIDPAFQGVGGPILKKLVEIQKASDWKMDDSVFQAWVRELEKEAS
jgi:Skp family chaperone for outer membrane proteins